MNAFKGRIKGRIWLLGWKNALRGGHVKNKYIIYVPDERLTEKTKFRTMTE